MVINEKVMMNQGIAALIIKNSFLCQEYVLQENLGKSLKISELGNY